MEAITRTHNSNQSAAAIGQGGLSNEVAHDIAYVQTMIVNVIFVGEPGSGDWVLVDAGMPFCANRIANAAHERFGPTARPRAIILTHGHFDHVGSLKELADRWDVQVYAHLLEMPFLTGQAEYPPPDPTVGRSCDRQSRSRVMASR